MFWLLFGLRETWAISHSMQGPLWKTPQAKTGVLGIEIFYFTNDYILRRLLD